MNSKLRSFAYLRIAFGLIWALDAYLKWQPDFFSGFVDSISSAAQNQPAIIVAWINLWTNIVTPHPFAWALATAIIQTALAIALLFGIFTRTSLILGGIYSFLIWVIPEGIGMIFMPGMTDPGAAIIYIFVFVALWLGESWSTLSIDSYLCGKKEIA